MKILLVEDDEVLIAVLTKSLAEHHYIVDVVKDGEMGWIYGSTFDYDLILLDIVLPKLDGIHLCQRLRAEGYTTPILLLTVQNTSMAKVSGLDAGADDYVVKPFDLPELIARIRALLRRSNASSFPLLVWGDLLLNPSTCEVSYNGHPLTLTNKEYELLELLLRDSQHLLSADEILDRLWSSDEFPSEATVRSHIRRLRHKLVSVGAPSDFIATVHGRGYYLKAPDPLAQKDLPTPPLIAPPLLGSQDSSNHSTRQEMYLAFLNEQWINTKPRSLEQVKSIFQVVQKLKSGELDPQSQAQAYQIAHKLTGTLGTLGLTIAMQLASQLENLLKSQTLLKKNQLEILEALAISLESSIQSIDSICNAPVAAISDLSFSLLAQDVSQIVTKVMIVDDDIDCLRSLLKLLQPWGFKVTTLADPKDFWTVLQSVLPDVLVLDVNMPQMNGIEICQALRSNLDWRRLPVLFLSVMNDANTQNLAFSVGADDYLCKPVVGIDLVNRIHNRLQRIQAYL
ncbi:response regulator [Pseudanabaena sp. 'Roaring Creek']|uniref:response regulator transcription factor n=1 Tax=Pseudanabaena sp. 'Roaring Creek' TaxID=1681830 RepID=UPI0006D7BA96|nr:response regulator [Pseudanabaena sp. 'Roaring Creek']